MFERRDISRLMTGTWVQMQVRQNVETEQN